MFGTNPIRKQRLGDGKSLEIQTVFPTIQGEGPYAGRPAIFVRLAGCNLRCHFCDTDFESRIRTMQLNDLLRWIDDLAMSDGRQKPTTLVVITGGEPFRQNLVPLCRELAFLDYDIQIETAGTLWIPGFENMVFESGVTIVCSPKTGKVHEKIAEFCTDWKYLIQQGEIDKHDGLPDTSTQVKGTPLKLFRPPRKTDTVWLQPCEAYKVQFKPVDFAHLRKDAKDGDLIEQQVTSSARDEEQSLRNIHLARDLAMRFNYRISLQIHKFLGIP